MQNFESAQRAYRTACGDYYSGANKASRQVMMDTLEPLVAAIYGLDLSNPGSLKALESFRDYEKYIKDDFEKQVSRGETLVTPPDVGVKREVDLIKVRSKIIEVIEAKQKAHSIQATPVTPAPSSPPVTVAAAQADQPKPNQDFAEGKYKKFVNAMNDFSSTSRAYNANKKPDNLKNLKDKLFAVIPLLEELDPNNEKHRDAIEAISRSTKKLLEESKVKPDKDIQREKILNCLNLTACLALNPVKKDLQAQKKEAIKAVSGFSSRFLRDPATTDLQLDNGFGGKGFRRAAPTPSAPPMTVVATPAAQKTSHTERVGRQGSENSTGTPPKPNGNGRGGR